MAHTQHTPVAEAATTTKRKARWLLPIAAASFVTLLYLLPQIVYTAHGHSGAVLLQEDEPMYVSRMVRALQGEPVSAPLILEHKGDVGVVSGFAERVLAQPFRLVVALGAPVIPTAQVMIVFWRTLLAFCSVLALVFALESFGFSRLLATLLALWIHLDAGVMAYKPILGLGWMTVLFDRLTNPLVGAPVFFLAWGCIARAMLRDENKRSWIVAAGIATGLSFYINFYYWTHLVAIVGLTALLEPRRRIRIALAIGAITALVSVRYWPYAFAFRSHPQYFDMLWRTDFRAHGRGVSFMPNRTMWIFVLATCALWTLSRTREARFFVMSLVAGVCLFYSGLVTGLQMPNSFQASHWSYSIAPIALTGSFWTGLHLLERSRFAQLKNRLLALLAVVAAVGGTVTMARLSRHLERSERGAGVLDARYAAAWQWLRDHTPVDTVVLASEETMAFEPQKAGKYVWVHFHTYPDPVGFEEMLDRYRVLWWLEAKSARALEADFAPFYSGANGGLWVWGTTRALAEELRTQDWPPIEVLRWRMFTTAAIDLATKDDPAELKRIAGRYRIDYIVRGPNERSWARTEQLFELEPVLRTQDVRIDRVIRWR